MGTVTAPTGLEVLERENARLQGQVDQVELLGELHLTEEDIGRLEGHIAALLQRQGLARGTGWLGKYYPHCLAVYLVGKGLFEYHSGDYWTQVRDGLRLRDSQFSSAWGGFFEGYVEGHRLARVRVPGAFRYV